ncbi:MAG: hypothetical protein ACOY3H_01510 [Bacillota bacterium]|uniref:Uncharacterized protein n=2 Tax=Carboxydocella TaxID=178898 RepID=A0A1T4PGU0_9FIRM|nr:MULTISPECIES: hypothetical protein [Carboxydocella]AVX21468.1 hypothetical protein CFE_2325 [Carboxydocella thermautotrophica]AVX31956.1 hypothetical protein CTH_2417 [Carboxydocella thermautotrophica]SJZ90783.1 hypothetical protein SAMN02745885_01280 [Carboxydocella sporoproducens DSM 16521]
MTKYDEVMNWFKGGFRRLLTWFQPVTGPGGQYWTAERGRRLVLKHPPSKRYYIRHSKSWLIWQSWCSGTGLWLKKLGLWEALDREASRAWDLWLERRNGSIGKAGRSFPT